MATPTCIKCGSDSFEVSEYTPKGSAYRLMSVHCSYCGGVVGMMDGLNIGYMMEKLTAILKERL